MPKEMTPMGSKEEVRPRDAKEERRLKSMCEMR
jgi:hypothetical protein